MPYADPIKRREANRLHNRVWRSRHPEKQRAINQARTRAYWNKAAKLVRLRRQKDPVKLVNRAMKLWHANNPG